MLVSGLMSAQSNYEQWDFLDKTYKFASFEAEGNTYYKTGHIIISSEYQPYSNSAKVSFTIMSEGKIMHHAEDVLVESFDFKWQLAMLYDMEVDYISRYLSVNTQESTITFGAPEKDAMRFNVIID